MSGAPLAANGCFEVTTLQDVHSTVTPVSCAGDTLSGRRRRPKNVESNEVQHVVTFEMPDLRFAIIATDTYVARRHAEIGLRRLGRHEEDVRNLVLGELQAQGYSQDEVERDIAYKEVYFLEDHLPRLDTYGLILMLFATYESVVKRLPQYVGEWAVADVTATQGDSFLAKARRFYRQQLGVSLFSDGKQDGFIRLIADVRNGVGHGTGQVSILRAGLQERLVAAAERVEGLEIADGVLQLRPTFVGRAAIELDEAAHGLIDRLRAAY